jgi:predicted HD phosphohydrolase
MDHLGNIDHEKLGAKMLEQAGMSNRVTRLVASHVPAKRYLTAKYPEYFEMLSPASHQTLVHQGGPMNKEEIAAFERDPLFEQYLQLRRWDEAAKVEAQSLPSISQYEEMITHHLLNQTHATN